VSGADGRRLIPGSTTTRLIAAFMLAQLDQKDLEALRELMKSGKVTPVIDRRYPLSEVPAAIEYLETGRARGKVVINVE